MKVYQKYAGGNPPAFFNGLLSVIAGVVLLLSPVDAPASDPETLNSLVELLTQIDDAQIQLDVLKGMSQALDGKRTVPQPTGWSDLEKVLTRSSNQDVRTLAGQLGVKFGSPLALKGLRDLVMNSSEVPSARIEALQTLVRAGDNELASRLPGLLGDTPIRAAVLNAMASLPHSSQAEAIVSHYSGLSVEEKKLALVTLASRRESALVLVAALESGDIPAGDLRAELVRQLRAFNIDSVNGVLDRVWGVIAETPEAKQKEIARYKSIYRAGGSQPGDASRGRTVFNRLCYQCHELFETGGNIGPGLTGSNRADLDYILENIVHPNAVVPNDYRTTTIETTDFRIVSGIIKNRTADAVTLATVAGAVVIPNDEVDSLDTSAVSMMPEGLLQGLGDQDVRDLIVYLKSPAQVPVIASKENLPFFFNGRDLSFWDGDPELWSVENGEIIGSAPEGLSRNAFLVSQMILADFTLRCEVRLTPNKENSGIQFRSRPMENGDVMGYQADIGAGWWGKLYEEHGRALLWDKSGESAVRINEWNKYEIRASGHHIQTFINGTPCVDLNDPDGALKGVIALQIHSGGPMEIRFRNFELSLGMDE